MAYYGCDFYREDQPEILYLRIDTYAYRNFQGPRGDMIAYCSLVPVENNAEDSAVNYAVIPNYVLCSILVGTCGKRFLVVYNCSTKQVEDWGQKLRKSHDGVYTQFKCDRSVYSDFDEVRESDMILAQLV